MDSISAISSVAELAQILPISLCSASVFRSGLPGCVYSGLSLMPRWQLPAKAFVKFSNAHEKE